MYARFRGSDAPVAEQYNTLGSLTKHHRRQSNCPYDSLIKRNSPCVWYGALEGDHRERGFRGHACTQNTYPSN